MLTYKELRILSILKDLGVNEVKPEVAPYAIEILVWDSLDKIIDILNINEQYNKFNEKDMSNKVFLLCNELFHLISYTAAICFARKIIEAKKLIPQTLSWFNYNLPEELCYIVSSLRKNYESNKGFWQVQCTNNKTEVLVGEK